GSTFINQANGQAAAHTKGDILVLANFTNGGAVGTVQVFEWDPTNPAAVNNLVQLNTSGNAAAMTNSTSAPVGASWRNNIPLNGFFEGGINLTQIFEQSGLNPNVHFSSFL